MLNSAERGLRCVYGNLIFNINSAYAEFERDIIRDMVKAGVKAKR